MADDVEMTPVAEEPPKANPLVKPTVPGGTVKLTPAVRKPVIGGTQTGLKPGVKLPTQPSLKPGIKLPTKPVIKPGIKLPTKPSIKPAPNA